MQIQGLALSVSPLFSDLSTSPLLVHISYGLIESALLLRSTFSSTCPLGIKPVFSLDVC